MLFPNNYTQSLKILDNLYENRIPNPEFNIFPRPGWGTGTPPDSHQHRRLDGLGISQYSHNYLTSSSSSSSSGDDIPGPTRTDEKYLSGLGEKGEIEEVAGGDDGGISGFRRILLGLEGLLGERIGDEEEEEKEEKGGKLVIGEGG